MKMCYDIEVIDHIFIYVSTHFTRSWYLKCLASAWVQVRRVGCLGLGEDSRSYFSRILNCRDMCNSAQLKAENVNIEERMTFKRSVGWQNILIAFFDGLFPEMVVRWMSGKPREVLMGEGNQQPPLCWLPLWVVELGLVAESCTNIGSLYIICQHNSSTPY